MYHYDFVLALHEDRLREAEKKRFTRQFGRRPSPARKRLLPRIGDLLIALGSRLNAGAVGPTQPHPPMNRLDLWIVR